MSEAADEEVKSPDGAPVPDKAEAAARFPLILMVSGLRAARESAAMRGVAAGNSPGVGARAYTEPTDKKNADAGCWWLRRSSAKCQAARCDALRGNWGQGAYPDLCALSLLCACTAHQYPTATPARRP